MAKVRINISLDEDIRNRLFQLAELEGKTVSKFITDIVRDKSSLDLDNIFMAEITEKVNDLYKVLKAHKGE